MFLFSHVVITLAAAESIKFAGTHIKSSPKTTLKAETGRTPEPKPVNKIWNYDIRLLVLGSLLPDIIDKPLGGYILRNLFDNGRIFGHTLLFFLLILTAGLILYWRAKKTWLFPVAFGVFIHFLLDSMWQSPGTLFWPLLGSAFPRGNMENWLGDMWHYLTVRPTVSVPELLGLSVCIFIFIWLWKTRRIASLIMTGRLDINRK